MEKNQYRINEIILSSVGKNFGNSFQMNQIYILILSSLSEINLELRILSLIQLIPKLLINLRGILQMIIVIIMGLFFGKR